MSHTMTQSDREFLVHLRRSGPLRIKQLCQAHGVTATAVRHRLTKLLAEGLVERTRVPAERGRPYHEYSVTDAAQEALGDDYASLAKLLWREVLQLDDGDARRQMMTGLRQALVTRYLPMDSATSLPGRFDQLRDVLEREGFEVETDERTIGGEALPILREQTCPYHELAAEDRSICELEQSVFEEVLGVPVALTQCCHDGHSCCEFEPALTG